MASEETPNHFERKLPAYTAIIMDPPVKPGDDKTRIPPDH